MRRRAATGRGRSIPACAGEPLRGCRRSIRRGVYPRVCGGTLRSPGLQRQRPGLSPRVRGNQGCVAGGSSTGGSIPACAGEPTRCLDNLRLFGVYPRVCGGTAGRRNRPGHRQGLSPRVRGNRRSQPTPRRRLRSIPACAGEPPASAMALRVRGVYPRVCGGTHSDSYADAGDKGLSPRVRGNPPRWAAANGGSRSIPACAGEPRRTAPCAWAAKVYPRVCGGTSGGLRTGKAAAGLSPRVRGNRKPMPSEGILDRSIPACAGEPSNAVASAAPSTVYPRVCGGTEANHSVDAHLPGLSPRVRGNLGMCIECTELAGSIPACAGEPHIFRSVPLGHTVYPRVCGGTPWPFDNASCYLIRQGNNGDPLAVTYQIHPSASTVSFGYFPQRQYPPHARRRRRPGHWL